MIFCARATRGLRKPSLDTRSGRSISPHPWRDNEQAWKDHFMDGGRSTLAVGDNLDHLLGALRGKRSSVDTRHSIHMHLVNRAQRRAEETPQPRMSLLCGLEQYPIAAEFRSQDEVHTLHRGGNSQAFSFDAQRPPSRAREMRSLPAG